MGEHSKMRKVRRMSLAAVSEQDVRGSVLKLAVSRPPPSPEPSPSSTMDWQFYCQKASISLRFLLRTLLHRLWRKKTPNRQPPSKTRLTFTKLAKKCAIYSIYRISDSARFLFERGGLTTVFALEIRQTKTCKTDKQGLNLANSSLNMSSRFDKLAGPPFISIYDALPDSFSFWKY